jgi:hypothetical protein
MQPLMFSIQSLSVRKDEQGAVVGLRMTANRVFSVVLPPITGSLVDLFGLTAAFVISGAFLLLICAGLAVMVARRPDLAFDKNSSRRGP